MNPLMVSQERVLRAPLESIPLCRGYGLVSGLQHPVWLTEIGIFDYSFSK
jgi:hypothetical protein